MDILLVPGLWLDASSWDAVLPALQKAGHRPRALTMPGVGEPASVSGDIGMADWVDAVVAEIDGIEGPVALVGHSGAGNVVYGAADARPDRVAHIVYVDTFPPADGATVGVDREKDLARGFTVTDSGITVVGKGVRVTP